MSQYFNARQKTIQLVEVLLCDKSLVGLGVITNAKYSWRSIATSEGQSIGWEYR